MTVIGAFAEGTSGGHLDVRVSRSCHQCARRGIESRGRGFSVAFVRLPRRAMAAEVCRTMKGEGLVAEAIDCRERQAAADAVVRQKKVAVPAPFSSSSTTRCTQN